jgi:hypothetical protein
MFHWYSDWPIFNGLRVAPSLGLSVMLCRSLFVHLSFFCWPLCCPSLIDLQILVAPLISSNSSYVTISVSTNYVSQGITFVSYDQSQKIGKNSLHWKALLRILIFEHSELSMLQEGIINCFRRTWWLIFKFYSEIINYIHQVYSATDIWHFDI